MSDDAYEFDATVTVRKRVHVAGPTDRETAREILRHAILGGLGFGPFAKYGPDGKPIEVLVSNDITLEDPQS